MCLRRTAIPIRQQIKDYKVQSSASLWAFVFHMDSIESAMTQDRFLCNCLLSTARTTRLKQFDRWARDVTDWLGRVRRCTAPYVRHAPRRTTTRPSRRSCSVSRWRSRVAAGYATHAPRSTNCIVFVDISFELRQFTVISHRPSSLPTSSTHVCSPPLGLSDFIRYCRDWKTGGKDIARCRTSRGDKRDVHTSTTVAYCCEWHVGCFVLSVNGAWHCDTCLLLGVSIFHWTLIFWLTLSGAWSNYSKLAPYNLGQGYFFIVLATFRGALASWWAHRITFGRVYYSYRHHVNHYNATIH